MKRFFTSESVTEGHPDKVCDQISDAVLDDVLSKDKFARVACETVVTTGLVMVMGEITTDCYVDIPKVVRNTLTKIGYVQGSGFDAETCGVVCAIHEQSGDIAMGVDKGGAGDQGMMFGYACKETLEYMPLAIMLSHKISKKLAELRKSGTIEYLRPDGKCQVTVEYDGRIPKRVDTVVLSTQHSKDADQKILKNDMINKVILPVIKDYADKDTKYLVNPTGRFEIGGPQGDSGLTGRKIIVDTYGGYAKHGGGCFSGKDPTKVDRSAAYMARYICKNIVAASIADECELEIAYAIGVDKPVSLCVNTFGTGKITDEKIIELINKNFDLTPNGIIKTFDLRRPIYLQTASYGHFGNNNYPWENLDLVDKLKKQI